MNEKTEINWQMHNFCKGGCSYCHSRFWGGEEPRHFGEYLEVAKKLIDHFLKLGRIIDWTFDGGEPLEFFDFPMLLKLCKENNGKITLHTSGGRLWLDWFAVEPNVDNLYLTYHYWQKPELIDFIIQSFQNKNKHIDFSVPIRPDFFDDDWNRAEKISSKFNLNVRKTPLYKESSSVAGLMNYNDNQLKKLFGEEWLANYYKTKDQTFAEKSRHIVSISPSFTGQRCNAGIEKLFITAEGWVSGSNCNNIHLGNIFQENFLLLTEPQRCKMIACVSGSDQLITKFPD